MGLDINAVQFLIAARKSGVEFGDVLTLGRQDLNVYPAKMKTLLEEAVTREAMMREREEELRQNMEELQATQEQLTRQFRERERSSDN